MRSSCWLLVPGYRLLTTDYSLVSSSSSGSLASGNRKLKSCMAGTQRRARIGCGLRGGIDGNAVEEEEPDDAVGIAVLDDPPQPPDHDLQPGLFLAFPGRGLGRRLAGLTLAAGELPVAGVNCSLRPAADQEVAASANQADAHVGKIGCAMDRLAHEQGRVDFENLEARKRHLNLTQVPSNLDARIAGSLETLGI